MIPDEWAAYIERIKGLEGGFREDTKLAVNLRLLEIKEQQHRRSENSDITKLIRMLNIERLPTTPRNELKASVSRIEGWLHKRPHSNGGDSQIL